MKTGPPKRRPITKTVLSVITRTFPIDNPDLSAIDNMKPSRGPEPTPAPLSTPPPPPIPTTPPEIIQISPHEQLAAGRKPNHKKRPTNKPTNTAFKNVPILI